jgi:hypothetical protein
MAQKCRQEVKTMMWKPKHWQDPVNAVLGVWLVLSPWVSRFSGDMTATANSVVIGVALLAAALGAMLMPRAWEEWTEAVLGLWMIVAPWVLGYSALTNAVSAAVVIGIVVLALALWTLATDREYSAWLRERKAH